MSLSRLHSDFLKKKYGNQYEEECSKTGSPQDSLYLRIGDKLARYTHKEFLHIRFRSLRLNAYPCYD